MASAATMARTSSSSAPATATAMTGAATMTVGTVRTVRTRVAMRAVRRRGRMRRTLVTVIGRHFGWVRGIAIRPHGLRRILLLLLLVGSSVTTGSTRLTSPSGPLIVISPSPRAGPTTRTAMTMGCAAEGECKGEPGWPLVMVNSLTTAGIERVDKVPKVGLLIVCHADWLRKM